MNTRQMILCFVGVVVVSLTSNFTFSQTTKGKDFIWWSPPGKEFAIEVPSRLKEFDDFGEGSDPNAVKNYSTKNSGHVFFVVVLKYKEFASKSTEDKFAGLFFTIGGDDDHDFTETNITINGLPAQEIAYKNQIRKGRFIDAGNIVVVLGMHAKNRKDLESHVANRFFSSFRLNRPFNNE